MGRLCVLEPRAHMQAWLGNVMEERSTSRTVIARRHSGPDAKGDVAYHVAFTPSELWLRHSVDIRDGEKILKLNLAPQVMHGSRVKLPGGGYERNGKAGDAYLLIHVVPASLSMREAFRLWRARKSLEKAVRREVITWLSLVEMPDAGYLSLELRGHFGNDGYYFRAWTNDGQKLLPLPDALRGPFGPYIDDPELLGRLVKPLCVREREGVWALRSNLARQQDTKANEDRAANSHSEESASPPSHTALSDAIVSVEREFKQVFFNLTADGRERVIQGTMIKKRCTRIEAMRIAIEEWRSDNR